jgi:hypothetical protein
LNKKMWFVTESHCLPVINCPRTTKYDNKVRELFIVCLPCQKWTETLVWFDDVGISAFHSCVVVVLWRLFPEWRLLLSECVLVYCLGYVRAGIRALSMREFLATKQITVLEHPPIHRI